MSREEPNSHTSASGQSAQEMSQAEMRAAIQVAMSNGDAHIERIRDILFGGHWEQIARQFTRLESLLQQETADLRDMFLRRFDYLEDYMKTEVEALNKRLTAQNARADTIEKLARDAKELGGAFEESVAKLAQQTEEGQHELREFLLEQSKALAADIRDRYDDLSVLLAQQLDDLRQVKTDRGTLASLFGEMAMRLNRDGLSPEQHEDAS
ncbi:hypothetical protein C2W62_02820 [Candidatus Entotheonella serta]|nr:hypothetical protein C2W62_02820 [Candidatus Entotheonella serta]